jgi:murein DD-endopeptidase MepM/ murein hydrolase activator NlpD
MGGKPVKRTFRKGRNVLNRNGLSRRYGGKNFKNKNRLKDNLKKLAICIIVVLLVVIIKNLDFSFAQKATDSIKTLVTSEYNFKKGLVSFKNLVPAVRDRVQSVFNDGDGKVSMIMPVDGPITSGYGMRVHPVFNTEKKHEGIDIDAEVGEPVKAALGGVVEEVRKDDYFGNIIVIDHGKGLKTVYGHLGEVKAVVGREVTQGEVIGSVGNTGISTGAHLHFEVWRNGKAVDPANELDKAVRDM